MDYFNQILARHQILCILVMTSTTEQCIGIAQHSETIKKKLQIIGMATIEVPILPAPLHGTERFYLVRCKDTMVG